MSKRFEVKSVFGSENLPDEIERMGLSENGAGSEYARYILIYANGELLEWYSDAMAPEDAKFGRDLNWISDAILRAYRRGADDGNYDD